MHKINSIQVLRAVAVTLVVYAHSIDSSIFVFGQSNQSTFYYLENWGSIGLDLFFVISGFIITRIIGSYQQPGGWKLFAYKRVVRIVPLYWSLSILTAILISRTYSIRLETWVKTLIFLPINEVNFEFPIIGVGWSLSYEMYFYMLASLALLMSAKRPQLLIIFALTLASFIGFFTNSATVLYRFMGSPLLLEFAMGVCCGLIFNTFYTNRWWYKPVIISIFFAGLTGMVSSLFMYYGDISEAGSITANNQLAAWRSLIWGIPCAFFLLGCVLIERSFSLTMPPLLIKIGDASYSNYLIHGILISFARKTILRLNPGADLYIIILVILCTITSLLVYRFIEEPMTRILTNYFFPRPTKLVQRVR